jgi:ferredoxin/flavodoxin---NADP+ reductase
MKRCCFIFAILAALSLAAAFSVQARMGLNVFRRPAFPNFSSSLLPPKNSPLGPYSLPLHSGSPHPCARDVSPNRASYPLGALLVASPDKFLPARILDRREIAEDLFILKIDPGGPYTYLAGQYATLGVENQDKRLERAYSIASSPYEPVLEFFVERVPEGKLSPILYEMKKDTQLLLRRFAKGRFTLDLRSGRKNHLLLATVTGVAPYVSYVRTLYQDWKNGGAPMPGEHRLFCVQGSSHAHEFGYREELEKIAAEAPWLKYVPSISRPWDNPDWRGELGRVDDLIRKYIEVWNLSPADTTAYLCGHPGMVENGRGMLLRAGWKKDSIQDEVYFQPGSSTPAA